MLVERRSLSRRLRAFLRSGNEGSALVELALVMGPMLAVMTAIFTFAIAFSNQLTLTQAVGAGAQYLQVREATSTNPCSDALTAIEASAPSLTPGSINVYVAINGVATTQTGNSCPNAALISGDPVSVAATYPCALSIMALGYGTQFISKCTLTAKSTEYVY
jgi:Flp pilus assembly protein TadG